jgi:hypothetical protein
VQTAQELLRKICAQTDAPWDKVLDQVEIQMNNATHAATGHTPYYADKGYHPTFPGEFPTLSDMTSESVEQFTARLNKIHQQLHSNLARSSEAAVRAHTKRHRPLPEFTVGEYVWVVTPKSRTGPGGKARPLEMRQHGPFQVLRARHPTYEIDFSRDRGYGGHPTRNADQLEKFTPDPNEPSMPLFPMPATQSDRYTVERIVAHEYRGTGRSRKLYFQVHWAGYPDPKDYTFEPRHHLTTDGTVNPDVLEYERKHGLTNPAR